jgi:cell division protein ZapA
MPAPVELRVGGQTYRVVASAEEQELLRLAQIVDAKLRDLTPPGRAISSQAMLLAALSLAHELEEERARRRDVERRSKEMLKHVLTRIDEALGDPELAPLERSDDQTDDAHPPEL